MRGSFPFKSGFPKDYNSKSFYGDHHHYGSLYSTPSSTCKKWSDRVRVRECKISQRGTEKLKEENVTNVLQPNWKLPRGPKAKLWLIVGAHGVFVACCWWLHITFIGSTFSFSVTDFLWCLVGWWIWMKRTMSFFLLALKVRGIQCWIFYDSYWRQTWAWRGRDGSKVTLDVWWF